MSSVTPATPSAPTPAETGPRTTPPPTGRRLQRKLDQHDRLGEKTTATAQAMICGFLLTLHLMSQLKSGAFGNIYVAGGLLALLASSAVRYRLADLDKLSERAFDLLTALDVVIFLAVIWSYHIAYGQPAGASLKAPSLVLLFAIVALRALRHDHRQVLVAGGTAVTGWLLMVWLATSVDGPGSVTNNYDDYLTSHRILIGAEIERVTALVMLVAILATAAWSARRLLSQAAHVEDYAEALDAARRHLGEAEAARIETETALGRLRDRDAELQQQNDRFAAALGNMSQGLCMLDAEHRLVVCNRRFAEIYDLPEILTRTGTPILDLIAHGRAAGIYAAGQDTPADLVLAGLSEASTGAGMIIELGNGRIIVIATRPMAHGGHVVTHEDITELRQSEDRLNHLAFHDPLTGLPNRTRFRDHLAERLNEAREAGSAVVAMILNLDRFKDVNDTFGQQGGDQLLRAVAQRLTTVAQPHMVSRLGADEFAMVVPTAYATAENTARRLAEEIENEISQPVTIMGRPATVGVSIGIARAPDDAVTAEELIKRADVALFGLKAERSGIYRFFEPYMDERMRRRRELLRDLGTAAAAGQLEVYYQPQLDLAGGSISGFEALLRWRHPDYGYIPPSEFIPLAEETGLIRSIGRWVLRKACQDAAQWPKHLSVAINLSAVEIQPELYASLITALAESGLAPSQLEIEVTESALMADGPAAIEILERIRSLGVRTALDDFGTGYASLSYLRMFPFNKIKIDRSFVADLDENRAGALEIIRCISHLGASLGMHTTAEGVETIHQLELVRSEGCTEIQGYLLSKPRPADDVARLLRDPLPFVYATKASAA